jgi:catechol 2,3-dioxygenase-like lactoylglutathione lyase family enzyme
MLRPTALDHVGLKVTDLDRTLDFYRALGLEVLRTSGPNGDGLRSAVLRVGSQELNVFAHPDFARDDRDKAAGMDHFALNMDAASIADVIAGLRHAGLEVTRGPVERRDGTSVFVHDPDGVRVELRIGRASA